MKLLASRNILAAVCVGAVLLLGFIFFGPTGNASQAKIAAAAQSAPDIASSQIDPSRIVGLDTVVADFSRNSTAALHKYRRAPFRGTPERIDAPTASAPAATVTFAGGKVIAYFSQEDWTKIAPPVTAGTAREFVCGDWRSGEAGSLNLYGCTAISR